MAGFGGVITHDLNHLQGPLANAFLILINTLFFNVKLIGRQNEYPLDSAQRLLNEEETAFDFIIVGAGAAGCVLANRLSEQAHWSVLLIEAGDYTTVSTGVPAFYSTFLSSPAETWQYYLELDKNSCQGYNDKRCRMSRGKVIGGTSSTNNLHYFRGDGFQEIGNYTDEIFESVEYNPDAGTGEIYLERENRSDPLQKLLTDSYEGLGYSRNNEKSLIGFMQKKLTIRDGERYNMAKAFLSPVKHRSNFFFVKNAVVDGLVVTEPVDKRAKGVNITIGNVRFFLRARKELILTAGAINNAKLLLLSGIGPMRYLEDKKIPVTAEIPAVGKNLQMHLMVPVFVGLDIQHHYNETHMIRDVFEYVMFKTGNLSNTGVNDFAAYISTDLYPNKPNIAIYHNFFKIGDATLEHWLEGLNFNNKISNAIFKHNEDKALLMFMITLLKPRSRGEVLLNDTHFRDSPRIKGNFFSDLEDQDLSDLLSAFAKVSNLTQSDPLSALGAQLLDIRLPSCSSYKFCSLSYVKCYIRNLATPNGNVAGTTRKGAPCDIAAVVNDDLELKNVRCLRIADSSVLPEITVGNTVTTDVMLGVRMAEILKKKWIKDYESPFGKNENAASANEFAEEETS